MVETGPTPPRVLVHLGYPKAGSTFLQSVLFSGLHPQIAPLGGRLSSHEAPRYRRSGGQLFLGGNRGASGMAPFTFSPEAARAKFDRLRRPDAPVSVISDEELLGFPFTGGFGAEAHGLHILETFPDARILIVVREQRAMVLSAYAHYLTRSTGTASLRDFLTPRRLNHFHGHQLPYYAYSRAVAWYAQRVRPGHLMVLPMELYRQDALGALNRVCAFAGVDPLQDLPPVIRDNARDYRGYGALRRVRGINFLGGKSPANGYGALGSPGLRSIVLRLVRMCVTEAGAERIRVRDMARIENALRAVQIPEDNAHLQSYLPEDDLSALGYMMPGADTQS